MNAIWTAVKDSLKQSIAPHCYRMWIEPIQFLKSDNEHLILSCPNLFYKKRVMDQYGDIIKAEINKTSESDLKIAFEVRDKKSISKHHLKTEQQLPLINANIQTFFGRQLRRDFTFDQFVVGSNNDFAYTASLSLASKKITPQKSLLLLSKTGMGKSHLSQAVGHHILSQFPNDHVYYITAEDFTNEMVLAFKSNCIEKFKKKYRDGCDVLLLEDIQYLIGKERSQVELALTLDFLYSEDKKVIFSSCFAPSEIPKLDEKLRSHLLSSIITNIEPPCYRTRVRILQKKAQTNGFNIPGEVTEYLAGELTEDVRQLESGLIGVTAKSSLLGNPIDLMLAESVVKNITRARKNITVDMIKHMVCRHYNIPASEIMSRSRKQCFSRPRQVAIYLARKYTDSPLQAIGKIFNRYHATALHAINSIEREIKQDCDLKKQIQYLCERLETGKF